MATSETQWGIPQTDLLKGKVALLTGGSRGIGSAIAVTLAQNGAQVVFDSRQSSEVQAQQVVDTTRKVGLEALWIPGDVKDPDHITTLVQTTLDRFQRLDIVVSNAGTRRDGLLIKGMRGAVTSEDWREVMETNLNPAFNLTQEALRPMTRQRSGSIIYISSVAAHGSPGQGPYSASKAGIDGLMRTTALEYANRNVRANSIAPGPVDTELLSDLTDKQREALLAAVPMKRYMTAQEVANTALFLASDLSSAITGQVINVDGGMIR